MQTKTAAWLVMGGLLFLVAACRSQGPVPVEPAAQTSSQQAATVRPLVTAKANMSASPPSPTAQPATATPLPTTTPVPAMPIPKPSHGPFTYHTVRAGETLGYLSYLYDTPLEGLVAMNDLTGPSALIRVDQVLRVPVQIEQVAPVAPLLPDSEVVYSPAYVDFDIAAFSQSQGGYLATYREYLDGQEMSGPEIVARVAEQFSVGPRLLLALLEYYGGWVTNPAPPQNQRDMPLGPRNPRRGNIYRALAFTANRVNAGYYGYKRDGFWIFELPDGSRAITAEGVNAGTVGVQNILALHSDYDGWQEALGPNGFMATYQTLFGDPASRAIEPLIPATLSQPPLSLPWAEGQGFYFTSGPHGGYVNGSGWAAIDFGPPDVLGNCFYSAEPNTAVAPGVIVAARQGEVQLDLDGDGQIQTGWVLLYLHVALDFDTPVQVDQPVAAGDVIGYASCEGGESNSSHLHLARRYNGEWIPAGGPVPMTLDGWVVQPNLTPYEGTIVKDGQLREACECWEPDLNLIVNN